MSKKYVLLSIFQDEEDCEVIEDSIWNQTFASKKEALNALRKSNYYFRHKTKIYLCTVEETLFAEVKGLKISTGVF